MEDMQYGTFSQTPTKQQSQTASTPALSVEQTAEPSVEWTAVFSAVLSAELTTEAIVEQSFKQVTVHAAETSVALTAVHFNS
ncbi:hypothetical protein PHYPSEUDO_011464 [Phytophthora pseudosyringae]|uniref:Uncharacterized protein n=1 Tax=Phytophthora pseudosyringae TaxID=221518 RepID=A0A8T1W6S7_9STRA|nr:hypothetical protein PHYPSEUDO_011464 [Phytophthora pseudosyringae]